MAGELQMSAQEATISFQELQRTLNNASQTLPTDELRAVLRHKRYQTSAPWYLARPAEGPADAAGSALASAQITDGGGARITVEASRKGLALRLASTAGISPIDAYVVTDSYCSYLAAEGYADELDDEAKWHGLTSWYARECLALPAVTMQLMEFEQTVVTGMAEEWIEVGEVERIKGWPAAETHIQNLFKGWASLAQRPLTDAQYSHDALFWAELQLQIQVQTLTILFLRFYATNERSAATSEGLIRAIIMSDFGSQQANRDVWADEPTCIELGDRIRDLLTLIAIDAMGVGYALDPAYLAETEGQGETTSLLGDKEAIWRVQTFLNERTDSLSAEEVLPPDTPIAILLLAWSFVLRALPADRQPGEAGYDQPMQRIMLQRALRPEAELIAWMEKLVAGPVLTDRSDSMAAAYTRKVFKETLIAFGILEPLAGPQEAIAINMMWSNLFASASPKVSLQLANDFWTGDVLVPERVRFLSQSEFPADPTSLPRVLAALSGISSSAATSTSRIDGDSEQSAVRHAFVGFGNMASVTVPTPRDICLVQSDLGNGRQAVRAAASIALPGGILIPRGSLGETLRVQDGVVLVRWTTQYGAWPILFEIMRVVVGTRGMQDVEGPSTHDRRYLSVGDLQIQRSPEAVLASGLALFSVMLKPFSGMANFALEVIRVGHEQTALSAMLEMAVGVLQQYPTATGDLIDNTAAALSALDILTSLAQLHPAETFGALRVLQFFALPSQRDSPACSLIRTATEGETPDYRLVTASLRLIDRLCRMSIQSPQVADETVIRTALHHVNADVWQMFGGWRDGTGKVPEDVAIAVTGIFDELASHPWGQEAGTYGAGATTVIDLFIASATGMTYKPIVDLLLGSSRRRGRSAYLEVGADEGNATTEAAASLLAALLRLARRIDVPATALPANIFAAAVGTKSTKLPLIEVLLSTATSRRTADSSASAILNLLSTYLDSTADLSSKTSLPSQLADIQEVSDRIATVATTATTGPHREAAWKLLTAIMLAQPGAHVFCIGTRGVVAGPLQTAIDQLHDVEALREQEPSILTAILGFLLAAVQSPALYSVSEQVHSDAKLWEAVFGIAQRHIPPPRSFMSKHEATFADEITVYANQIQARANAAGILAAEVDLLVDLEDEQGGEGKRGKEDPAKKLILAAFRKSDKLERWAEDAMRNWCAPDVHVNEQARLAQPDINVRPETFRTTRSTFERAYGHNYLYDGRPQLVNEQHKAIADSSMSTLNLDRSVLEADNAFTAAWHRLVTSASTWSANDGMAAKAALSAAMTVTEKAAAEQRGGDEMSAVQVERLWILATLLETAFDPIATVEVSYLSDLTELVHDILTSPVLVPISAARDPQRPPVHRPLLRILSLLLRQVASLAQPMPKLSTFIGAAGDFILAAADAAFDAIRNGAHAESDLVLVTSPLIELINTGTSMWLALFSESALIQRSLDLIKRMTITADQVPPHIPSILLFHLALTNHPSAAEKLAVSGIIPAYSDNVVAVEAEVGRVEPKEGILSVHATWCGMLLVVQNLLATLPAVSSFAEHEVAPFVRLARTQIEHGLRWGAESHEPLTRPALDEMRAAVEVLFGLSKAIPGNGRLLADHSHLIIRLLCDVRYSLTHPRHFASTIVPSSAEEHARLIKELEVLDKQPEASTILVKIAETPIIGGRVLQVLQVAQMAMRTLIGMTDAWAVLTGDQEPREVLVLGSEATVSHTSEDPVGIINDVHTSVTSLVTNLGGADPTEAILAKTCHQIAEASSLLSASQILVRRTMLLRRTGHAYKQDGSSAGDRKEDDDGMAIDSKPITLSVSPKKGALDNAVEEATLLDQLEEDWKGISGGSQAIGDSRLGTWLGECLDKTFTQEE